MAEAPVEPSAAASESAARPQVAEGSASAANSGAALIARTLGKLAGEDDHRHVQPAEWDPRLVELTTALKTRIPEVVEERCRRARQRSNCGLLAQTHHAWASADEVLHIWDYHRDKPQVLTIPADSAIVSVAAVPPRPGIFEGGVNFLLVICTRLTVSLVGMHYTPATLRLCREQRETSSSSRRPSTGSVDYLLHPRAEGALETRNPLPGDSSALEGLRLVALEGYSARTDGALFHLVRHTADGHILLGCGAPQVYELAYSRDAGWFTSKCRLIRHAGGFQARVRDLLHLSWKSTGRLRLLECASQAYVVAVDDASTIHLFRLQDWAVFPTRSDQSVAVLQELAALAVSDLAQMAFDLKKHPLASRIITHVFPILGLDGQLRLQVVTAASERLLFVCSSPNPNGPPRGDGSADWSIVQEFESDWTQNRSPRAARAPAAGVVSWGPGGQRYHGFWLQQVTESRLGHGGTTRTMVSSASAAGTAQQCRACLEEFPEPCVYANGLWLASAAYPGSVAMEVGITARVDDFWDSGGSRSLYTSIMLDSQLLDMVEESEQGAPAATTAAAAAAADRQSEPLAFRPSRSFALLLPNCVQVLRLTFKATTTSRAPATPGECCAYLAQLSRPGQGPAPSKAWPWSFDDVGVPAFEEQRQHLAVAGPQEPLPGVRMGRWLQGLLRFLAVALRPVWDQAVVVVLPSQQGPSLQVSPDQLSLGIPEESVRRLLARLRPVLDFAQQGLKATASTESNVPASCTSRFKLYTQRGTRDEAAAQARRTLQDVLKVASRATELLALMSLLYSQQIFRQVLNSSTLGQEAFKALRAVSFGHMVASEEAMQPAVELCTALVAESRPPKPAATPIPDPVAKGKGKGLLGRGGLVSSAAELVFDPAAKGGGKGAAGTGGLASPATESALNPAAKSAGKGDASAEVCRELAEQCPTMFEKLDLSVVCSQLSDPPTLATVVQVASRSASRVARIDPRAPSASPNGTALELLQRYAQGAATRAASRAVGMEPPAPAAAAPGAALELLQRYAQCVCLGSPEDHWAALAQSLRAAARESPRRALEVCAGKLQQLQLQQPAQAVSRTRGHPGAEVRAKQLLDALLGALSNDELGRPPEDRVLAVQSLVEQLLSRTASVQFANDQRAGNQRNEGGPEVPFVHAAVLDHLLALPELRPVLEALLQNRLSDPQGPPLEAFLQERATSSKAAGDLLWRHRVRQGKLPETAEVLLCIAESKNQCTLEERVRYLDQARQAAQRGLPTSKDLLDQLAARLDAAARVQLPLQREMDLLVLDTRVSERWRAVARQKRQALEDSIWKLQELYQLAVDFSFYHLVLIIADISSTIQEREEGFSAWLQTFLPSQATPYSIGELMSPPPATPHGLFPLLMVRRSANFLLQTSEPFLQPAADVAKPEDFQVRVVRLLAELSEALRAGSPLWEVGCVVTLLEYCSCVWRKALKEVLGNPSAEKCWVPMQVLSRKPFQIPMAGLLKLYAAVLSNLPTWAADLRRRLSADSPIPGVKDPELSLHIAEVALALAQRAGEDGAASSSLRPGIQALLSDVRTALEKPLGQEWALPRRQLLEVVQKLDPAPTSSPAPLRLRGGLRPTPPLTSQASRA